MYLFVCFRICCHTGRFPPSCSHCLCLFTLLEVVVQLSPQWQGALLHPSLWFSETPSPLFSQLGLATSHRNSTCRIASKINTKVSQSFSYLSPLWRPLIFNSDNLCVCISSVQWRELQKLLLTSDKNLQKAPNSLRHPSE